LTQAIIDAGGWESDMVTSVRHMASNLVDSALQELMVLQEHGIHDSIPCNHFCMCIPISYYNGEFCDEVLIRKQQQIGRRKQQARPRWGQEIHTLLLKKGLVDFMPALLT
jgi:hypothetical protein